MRDREGKFLPGESGNPSGRPKLSTTVTSELIGLLESDVETKREIARKWIKACQQPDMRALQELLDRTEGKVADKHLIQGLIVHVGNEYAQLGLEANRKELEERKQRYIGGNDAVQGQGITEGSGEEGGSEAQGITD